MKIIIANDHRGYSLKCKIIKYLNKKGYEYEDLGTDSLDSVDYPDYAFLLGEKVVKNKDSLGIAICGSGIGISIACNKVKGIRCAKVNNVRETKLAIKDNNANIIAISGKTPLLRTLDILDTFLLNKHEENERHDRRILKISEYESKNGVEEVKPKRIRRTKKDVEKDENKEK